MNELESPPPLRLKYSVIVEALEELLPDHCEVIINCIRRLILIDKRYPEFSTMGITRNGDLIICIPFWNKYVTSMDILKILLYHELLHHVSGDVYSILEKDAPDYKLINAANNIAMDSRINAFISQTKQELSPDQFFESMYGEESEQAKINPFAKILKPHSILDANPDEIAMKPFYDSFYKTDDFHNHDELKDVVLEILKRKGEENKGENKENVIVLLGAHGTGDPGENKLTPEQLENATIIDMTSDKSVEQQLDEQAVEQTLKDAIVDHLNQQATLGHGHSNQITSQFLNRSLHITEKFNVAKFKKLAFDSIFHNVRTAAKQKTGKYTSIPYLPNTIAPTDLLLLADDLIPIMWKGKKYSTKIDKNLLPIYLDVSGSTWSHLPDIVRLIANVSDELDFVFGFSDVVEKHTIEELNKGIIKGTGGTCFNCIVNHAKENDYKHIVVISDGDGSCYLNARAPWIDSVVTILFGYSTKNNYFTKNYANTYSIDEVKL